MTFRVLLAAAILALCVATTHVAAVSNIDCPNNVAPTCKDGKKCRPFRDSGNATCVRCKSGFTRNPDNGECVECDVPGCGLCRVRNKCAACKDGQVLLSGDRTCAARSCPAGCQECAADDGEGTCAKCWPCGRRYRALLGDTVESVAARCGVTVSALTGANEKLAGMDGEAPLADAHVLKVPPVACPGSAPTASGSSSGGPATVPNCPVGTFWLSCYGSVYCPLVDGNLYGCVSAETCLGLYDDCLEANPDCPNCCFSRSCTPQGSRPETWYFMTFSDGSAHCDPWGRWYG